MASWEIGALAACNLDTAVSWRALKAVEGDAERLQSSMAVSTRSRSHHMLHRNAFSSAPEVSSQVPVQVDMDSIRCLFIWPLSQISLCVVGSRSEY